MIQVILTFFASLGVGRLMSNRDAECIRQRVADLEVGQAARSIFMAKSIQLLDFSSKTGR